MRTAPGRSVIGAAVVLAIAAIAFGYSLVRAIHVDTGAPPPLPVVLPDDSARSSGDAPLSGEALMLAVENDPFQPDRVRPSERYRLPGDVEEAPPPPPPAAPPPPDFRLGGTVVFDGGGMALLQVGDGAQSFVNVGEAVNGYRLTSVSAREAVLENPFGSVTLEVAGPPQTVAVTDDADEERGRRRNQREGRAAGEEVAVRQLVQQALVRARQGGATPQQLRMIEALAERGGNPQQMMQMLQRILRNGGGADRTIEIPPPPPPPPGRQMPPAR